MSCCDPVGRFIQDIELLLMDKGDPDPIGWGVVPALSCYWCGGLISVAWEGDCLWIHDGGQGVDLNDPCLRATIEQIRRERPSWKLRSDCKLCHEELTFLQPHKCRDSLEAA
jgi:hypothetical protein